MKRLYSVLALGAVTFLAGCVSPPPRANDPYYAPVLPRTPLPAAANNGSIYQAGFEQNLYSDRKAFRVGDIITITLNEKTQASKNANSQIGKTSKTGIGLTSLFGGVPNTNNPLGGGDLSLEAGYSGDRATNGKSAAGQGNSLTGFTVSNLQIPGFVQPWEVPYGKPERIVTALDIMIEGPLDRKSVV